MHITHAVVCFNWSVWHESRVFFKTLGHPPAHDAAVARICKRASSAWLSVAKPTWRITHAKMPASSFTRTIPPPPHLRNPYGSAGRRTQQQRANCVAYATAMLARLPDTALSVFTDGSAAPTNPGPCGAGAAIRRGDHFVIDLSQPLGHGTNNIGELWAIGMGASYLTDHPDLLANITAIHIFSDSRLITNALRGVAKYTSEPALLAMVLARLAALRAYAPVSLHWLPGHVGVTGNEAADVLAGTASARSAVVAWPSNFNDLMNNDPPPPSPTPPLTPPPPHTRPTPFHTTSRHS
jgi:ribonuclease HI